MTRRPRFAESSPIELTFEKLDAYAYEALSRIGRYEVRNFGDRTQSPLVQAVEKWVWRWKPTEEWKDVESLDAAKAACQMHFDGTIALCLRPI